MLEIDSFDAIVRVALEVNTVQIYRSIQLKMVKIFNHLYLKEKKPSDLSFAFYLVSIPSISSSMIPNTYRQD